MNGEERGCRKKRDRGNWRGEGEQRVSRKRRDRKMEKEKNGDLGEPAGPSPHAPICSILVCHIKTYLAMFLDVLVFVHEHPRRDVSDWYMGIAATAKPI